MTNKELSAAFVAFYLAVRDKIEYPNEVESVKTLAYSYGANISDITHIDQVFHYLDWEQMVNELVKE